MAGRKERSGTFATDSYVTYRPIQEMHTLPDFNKIIFPLVKPTSWEDIVPNASPGALLVLQKLIVYSSARRATARQV